MRRATLTTLALVALMAGGGPGPGGAAVDVPERPDRAYRRGDDGTEWPPKHLRRSRARTGTARTNQAKPKQAPARRLGKPPAQWRQRLRALHLTRQEFTELVADELLRVLPGSKVTVEGSLALNIKTAQGDKIAVGLHNGWRNCANDPKSREAEVNRYVDSLLRHLARKRKLKTLDHSKHVVPLIKGASFLAQIKAQTGGKMKPMVEHIAGDIWIVYALDMPKQVAIMSQDQGRALASTPAALRQLALTNLRRVLKPIKHHGNGPVYVLTAGGMYESSILLLDEFWPAQAQVVAGDVVAAVPNRDVLLFAGSKSKKGIAGICKLMAKAGEGAYAISRTLLVRRGGVWKVFGSCSNGKLKKGRR